MCHLPDCARKRGYVFNNKERCAYLRQSEKCMFAIDMNKVRGVDFSVAFVSQDLVREFKLKE